MAIALLVFAGLAAFATLSYQNAKKQQALSEKQQALSAAAATLDRDPAKSLESALRAYRIDRHDVEARAAVIMAGLLPRSRIVAGPDPKVVGDRKPRVVGMDVIGERVIAYDAQGGIFVITGRDAVERRPTAPHAEVVRGAVSGDGSRVALADDSGGVTIVDISTTKEPINLATPKMAGSSWVSWLGADNLIQVLSPSGDVATYSANTGKLAARFPGSANSVSQTADGQHVVTSDQDNRLRVWDPWTGRKIAESAPLEMPIFSLKPYKQFILGLSLFSTERAIVVWDWQRTLAPELHHVSLGSYQANIVEVDQKNDVVSIAVDKRIIEVSLPNADKFLALPDHTDSVNNSTRIGDGRWIATAGHDGRILVWSGYNPHQAVYELLGHEGPVQKVGSLRDGQALVSLGVDGTVRWWDTDLSRVQRFDMHKDWVLYVDVDSTGTWLATMARDSAYIVNLGDLAKPMAKLPSGYMLDGGIVRFDPTNPHHVFTLKRYEEKPQGWRWENDGSVHEDTHFATPPLGNSNYLVSFAISRDGKTAAAGDNLGTIYLWDAKTGRLLPQQPLRVPDEPAWDMAFDSSGQFLATVGQQGVRLWKLGTNKPATLGRLNNAITVTFDPSGHQLVTTAQGGKLRVWSWNGQDLRNLRDFDVHGSSIGRPSFSADGRLLAVGTAEGLIEVWETKSGGAIWLTRQHGDFVNDVVFMPGNRPSLLSASDDTTVALSPCDACQDPDGFADRVDSSYH